MKKTIFLLLALLSAAAGCMFLPGKMVSLAGGDAVSAGKPDDMLGTWYRTDGELAGDRQDTAAHGMYSAITVYKKYSPRKGKDVYYADYIADDRYDAVERFDRVPLKLKNEPADSGLAGGWTFSSNVIHSQVGEMKEDVTISAGFADADTLAVILYRTFPDSEDGYPSVYSGNFVRTVPACYGLIPDDLAGTWKHSVTEDPDGSLTHDNGTFITIAYDGGHMTARNYETADDLHAGLAATARTAYEDPVYRPAAEQAGAADNPYWQVYFYGPDYRFNENIVTLTDRNTLLWITRIYDGINCSGDCRVIRDIYVRKEKD